MKSKAPLQFMEQLVMLLVFALAAALCLQVFVLSSRISRRCEARDRAVSVVQSTAESVKACKGDASFYARLLGGSPDSGCWLIAYDSRWEQTDPDDASYYVRVSPAETPIPTLGRADISAETAAGEELFFVAVSWQEVNRD